MRSRHTRTVAAVAGLLGAPVLASCVTYLPAAPPPVTITAPAAPAAPYQVPQSNSVQTSGCVASYETAQSHVDICGSAGSLYYYGSSDSGSITLRAYPDGDGYLTERNDGHVYHVDDTALTITRYGSTIATQPVLSTSGS